MNRRASLSGPTLGFSAFPPVTLKVSACSHRLNFVHAHSTAYNLSALHQMPAHRSNTCEYCLRHWQATLKVQHSALMAGNYIMQLYGPDMVSAGVASGMPVLLQAGVVWMGRLSRSCNLLSMGLEWAASSSPMVLPAVRPMHNVTLQPRLAVAYKALKNDCMLANSMFRIKKTKCFTSFSCLRNSCVRQYCALPIQRVQQWKHASDRRIVAEVLN